MPIDLNRHYKREDSLITKQIEEQLIIIPLHSEIGDLNSELYSLNKTGNKVWEMLDGKICAHDIVQKLADEYHVSYEQIKPDIVRLINTLLKKKLIQCI